MARKLSNPEDAGRICERHNRHFRLESIIGAIRHAATGDARPLNVIREQVCSHGAFLMEYTPELIAGRIAHPLWVVTEQLAARTGSLALGGDCQIRLHPDRLGGRPLVPLPVSPADCRPGGWKIAEEIRQCPAIAAQVADLCADDEVRGKGYVNAAKCAAFEVIRELNRTRVRKIKYVLGEMFVIKGVRLPDESEILLSAFGQHPLVNRASMKANTHGPEAAADAWDVRDWHDYIPRGKGGELLLTDWIVLVRDLGAR